MVNIHNELEIQVASGCVAVVIIIGGGFTEPEPYLQPFYFNVSMASCLNILARLLWS